MPVFTDAGDETLVRFHVWNEHPFSFNDFEAVPCESEPWGVDPKSVYREVFVSLAYLLQTGRYELALELINSEIKIFNRLDKVRFPVNGLAHLGDKEATGFLNQD